MKTALAVIIGGLLVQALLILGYLAGSRQDPILINPDRSYDDSGVAMVMFCGEDVGNEMLDKVPPDGESGPWTRGRTLTNGCAIFYHHDAAYHACFHDHPTLGPCRRGRFSGD